MDIAYVRALDASGLPPVTAAARFADTAVGVRVGDLPGYRPSSGWTIELTVPEVPGTHDLIVQLRAGTALVAQNQYPIHVVVPGPLAADVCVAGGKGASGLQEALELLGARVGPAGTLVVAEEALDSAVGGQMRDRLAGGETVVLLAQTPQTAPASPVPMTLVPVETAWGSSVFHLTTDAGSLPCLPRRAVLAGEDGTVHATSVVSEIAGGIFPDTPVVVAYKPVPGAMTGTIAGAHAVGSGRLILCQYRLTAAALRGDALARALLGDLVRWAAAPPARMVRERVTREDGRRLWLYNWEGTS